MVTEDSAMVIVASDSATAVSVSTVKLSTIRLNTLVKQLYLSCNLAKLDRQ